jgi:hypothetical protein
MRTGIWPQATYVYAAYRALLAYSGDDERAATSCWVVCWSNKGWCHPICRLLLWVVVCWVQACCSWDVCAASWNVWVGSAGLLTAVTTCIHIATWPEGFGVNRIQVVKLLSHVIFICYAKYLDPYP